MNWISVEDRLPETNMGFGQYKRSAYVLVAYFYIEWNFDVTLLLNDPESGEIFWKRCEPTHWAEITSPSQNHCPNCGDDRTGKASLIQAGNPNSFCSETCFEQWSKVTA